MDGGKVGLHTVSVVDSSLLVPHPVSHFSSFPIKSPSHLLLPQGFPRIRNYHQETPNSDILNFHNLSLFLSCLVKLVVIPTYIEGSTPVLILISHQPEFHPVNLGPARK